MSLASGRFRLFRLLPVTAILFPLLSCSPGTAVIGAFGADVASRDVLKNLDDRATHVIQNAAAAGSLVSSKAARDAELLINAARQNLDGELDTQWSKLDREKIEMLRKLDEEVSTIERAGAGVTKLEDTVYLDTDSLASRIPFAKTMPHFRQVTGASQFYKVDGTYDIHMTSNVFAPFGPETKVTIGQSNEPIQIIPDPPYSALIRVPNDKVNFAEFKNIDLPITIKTTIEEKHYFSKNVKRSYTFTIPIQLFAKYPAYYQMDQVENVDVVDPTVTSLSKGAFLYAPGCGNDGCNSYFRVCTPVPLGAQFVGVVNPYDSFGGWGEFTGDQSVELGQVCKTYHQHSHNVGRNVSFDVQFHPTKKSEERTALVLKPLIAGKAADPLCTPRAEGIAPKIEDKVVPSAVGVSDNVCWVQFNTPYFAEFKPGSSRYRLVVHRFDGKNFSAVDGALTEKDSAIEIHDLPEAEHATLIKILEPK